MDVERLIRFAEEHGLDPDSGPARSGFAVELDRRGEAVAWPPGRNEPCWCGSGHEYKGARRLGFADTAKTSVIRSMLIDTALIFSPEYGLVDFTVPHFAEYMRPNFPLDAGEEPD